MIYLIDDKKLRQLKNYNWTKERLAEYEDILQPIYKLDGVLVNNHEIFNENNFVLYHESFLDTTEFADKAAEKRNKLEKYAKRNPNFKLVIFSGSKGARIKNGNIVHMPVSHLYENLEVFLKQYKKGNTKLEYLMYGSNPDIEKKLIEGLENALLKLENQPAIIEDKKNLFIPTFQRMIDDPIHDAKIANFFDEETDKDISEFIHKELDEEKFDNIFLPLCYGSSFSDYNGLRLATHIRCTENENRLSRIFIYSFVPIGAIINTTYFNILKTKNVFLIPFSKTAFAQYGNLPVEEFSLSSLTREISKLNLEVPQDYEDSHSIANEWAIYRWVKTLNAEDECDISGILEKVQNNIYFKYLKTIHPIKSANTLPPEEIEIPNLNGPRILLIDDEAHKGWNDLIAFLTLKNNVYSDYLETDFRHKETDDIIDEALEKIEKDQINVVILDFRLKPSDFDKNDIGEITSVRLLKKIKKLNPGIQVIILSATNKIWNLQALLDAGADSFVIKESPQNSIDPQFTSHSIKSFIDALSVAVQRIFLIDVFSKLDVIEKNINNLEYADDTDYHDFIRILEAQLKIIKGAAKNIHLSAPSSLDIVFLNCFNFLEQFKNEYYIKPNNYGYSMGIDEISMRSYFVETRRVKQNRGFKSKPNWFESLSAIVVDYFKICHLNNKLVFLLNDIKNYRNNFIHNDKPHFEQSELFEILEIMDVITAKMKE